MIVKSLIEKLEKVDENLSVVFFSEMGYADIEKILLFELKSNAKKEVVTVACLSREK